MINPFSDIGKETQNPFLDTRIRIWIFPKKRTLSEYPDNQNILSVRVTFISIFSFFPSRDWTCKEHTNSLSNFDHPEKQKPTNQQTGKK